MPEAKKIEDIKCHVCMTITQHTIIHQEIKKGSELINNSFEVYWSDTQDVILCNGCRSLSIRNEHYFSEEDGTTVSFIPDRNSGKDCKPPDWGVYLPFTIRSLQAEVYKAKGMKCFQVAAMGIRALLEMVMIEKVKDIGGFDQKLAKMKEKGYLSELQMKVLVPTIEIGHAAMHRSHSPNEMQIEACIRIADVILETIYIHPNSIVMLKQNVRPRRRIKKPRKKSTTPIDKKQATGALVDGK